LVGFVWQAEQALPACLPDVIGNQEWVNLPRAQELSVALWQVSHVVGKLAPMWFGFVVFWYLAT
jgi:hypothetical protein